jgi:hypothetical protein
LSECCFPSTKVCSLQTCIWETRSNGTRTRFHKPTGQAYVNLGGKVVYLGKYGTDESKSLYNQVKAEWLVNRHSEKYSPQATGPTIADICLAFLDHAEVYYATSDEAHSTSAMATSGLRVVAFWAMVDEQLHDDANRR